MKITISSLALVLCIYLAFPDHGYTKSNKAAMSEDKQHINSWNQFAQRLYILHLHQIAQTETITQESKGGYATNPDFYREVKYFDKKSSHLLSRVLWEIKNPEQIHEIEVFVYDNNGKLKRDYLAAFLPGHRNAPIQTLINLHYQNDELKSFRQFDASGDRIYERCEGKFFGTPLNITITDDDLVEYSDQTAKLLESEEYLACFGNTLTTLGDYADPLYDIPLSAKLQKQAELNLVDTSDSIEKKIKVLTSAIKNKPSAKLFYERGMANFKLNKFDTAAEDFTQAIKLDDTMDDAYFGRGLAHGRMRMFEEGIADLSVFIKRNPQSSVAYTKRGVRKIWAGDYKSAEDDLRKAISLDPKNAEAHDDLGVMEARKGQYNEALQHFKKVVEIDPTYSKGHHNLAMTQYILGNYKDSLVSINKALELMPNDKNALLLKGETLIKLGKHDEGKAILDRADFLPEGGWSERFAIQ